MNHIGFQYKEAAHQFQRLIAIMDELREKCPWDKKQTIQTLRTQTIEETYELADAILNNNWDNLKEELGDVLLHIVFYSKIAAEKKEFTLQEVIQTICDKLIKRHPHIYGNVTVNNEEDVKKNWEQLKLKEGKTSVLSGVPASLPAVVKAQRIQDKAKAVGFEWNDKREVYKKVEEELGELAEAIENNDAANIEEEFGDVMFSLINYARFINVDAEAAIEKTNQKFMYRFREMEKRAKANGKNLSEMTLAEMDDLWNKIKQNKTEH
ncbi:MAG: nucleoside triphosphate pyrophosphohydrolase [Bacteroidota bacterium]|nr:nucleoside triphosphate pyrophosphohydrolase [Bacteroidota bacterium]